MAVRAIIETVLVDTNQPLRAEVPGLPPEVVARLVTELGGQGNKVIDCLRTAAALISQAGHARSGLRLAESAAYNIREALDAVVEGRAAPEGGVGAAVAAWRRYQLAVGEPGADAAAARAELDGVLGRLEQDEERQAFKTRKLLEYIRSQTGIEPLPGEDDPTVRYSRLRKRANDALHDYGTASAVTALYDDALAWFIRFFTPPDDRVRAVTALAERPYADGIVDELRKLVLNFHHLGLFFSRLQDPGWLDPLHEAGLIPMPREGEPWPVTRLVEGAGAIEPERLAAVLDRLLCESKHEPEPRRLGIARQILQDASRLGAAGHELAKKIITKHYW